MNYPKISIVTPSYNQGRFLETAICSVIGQEYPDLEHIIIDGESTDNSVEIIKKYEKNLTYWVSEKDNGQSDAINKGFAKAAGDIFAWLNSDDMYCPGVLHRIAKYWIEHPDCQILTGDGEFVDYSGSKREYYIKAAPYSFKELLYSYGGKYLPQPSVFFSKKALRDAGGLDSGLHYIMDFDLWLKITKKYPLHYLPICFSKLRRHENAKTREENGEAAMVEVTNVIENYIGDRNILSRFFIRRDLRFFYARAICEQGLKKYFNKDLAGAAKSLRKALELNQAVIFSSQGLKLASRIILSRSVKKKIFAKS